MNLLKTLLTGILIGFTSGFLATNTYHLNTRKKERQVFIECQQAWEKYYSLTNQTSQVIQPIEPSRTFWQIIKHQLLTIAQTKTQELMANTNQPFSLEQQKYLVYHYEMLPKCSKLKDWKRHMQTLSQNI